MDINLEREKSEILSHAITIMILLMHNRIGGSRGLIALKLVVRVQELIDSRQVIDFSEKSVEIIKKELDFLMMDAKV